MSRLAEFRALEQQLAAQLAELETLKNDDGLKREIEFEKKLRSRSRSTATACAISCPFLTHNLPVDVHQPLWLKSPAASPVSLRSTRTHIRASASRPRVVTTRH